MLAADPPQQAERLLHTQAVQLHHLGALMCVERACLMQLARGDEHVADALAATRQHALLGNQPRRAHVIKDQEPRRARPVQPCTHLVHHLLVAKALHTDAAVDGEGAQIGCKRLRRLGAQPHHEAITHPARAERLVVRRRCKVPVAVLGGQLRLAHAAHPHKLDRRQAAAALGAAAAAGSPPAGLVRALQRSRDPRELGVPAHELRAPRRHTPQPAQAPHPATRELLRMAPLVKLRVRALLAADRVDLPVPRAV